MNPEILKQLRDVHLPKAPSWWPLPPGYYLAFFVLLASVLLVGYFYKKKKPAWALRKNIQLELQAYEQSFLQTGDTKALQSNIGQLLRRVATKMGLMPTKNASLIDLCPRLEKLWGPSQTRELLELLEHNRFSNVSTLDGSYLLALANKKFKQCKL